MVRKSMALLAGGLGLNIAFALGALYILMVLGNTVYSYTQLGFVVLGFSGFFMVLQAILGVFVILYLVSLLQGIHDRLATRS